MRSYDTGRRDLVAWCGTMRTIAAASRETGSGDVPAYMLADAARAAQEALATGCEALRLLEEGDARGAEKALRELPFTVTE